MARHFIRIIIVLIVRILTKIQVTGIENLPKSGSFIVASNHLGRLDAFLVYYIIKRDDIILAIAEKYQKYAFIRWIAARLDAFFLDRFQNDVTTIRQIIRRLQNGGVFVAAPEGTRSKTEALLPGKSGVSYIAVKTGLPVVPVAVTGSEDAGVVRSLHSLRRVRIHIRVGKSFQMTMDSSKSRQSELQRLTDDLMCKIGSMLPERYRGVYANHPILLSQLTLQDGNFRSTIHTGSTDENYYHN